MVLHTIEELYQYFSHHLQTFLEANSDQSVNMVVSTPEIQSSIHLLAKIGNKSTQKNFAWCEKQR
jgi:hypothetical protein